MARAYFVSATTGLAFGSLQLCGIASAQTWPDANAGLIGLRHSALAWGDYDNDDDLDIVVTGWAGKVANEPTITTLYRNNGGAFAPSGAALVPVQNGAVAWGDYDRDGDLDLAISGQTDIVNFSRVTKIYRNNAGAFSDIAANIPGVNNGSLAWGDYDNDGDLDLAVAGWTGSNRITRVYRNNAGAFLDSGATLMGVNYGTTAWADYDNDGDLDLAVCGWAGGSTRITRIYRNQSGAFADIDAGLPGVQLGALTWGDYDNDGDFDLLVSGSIGGTSLISRVYSNDAGGFVDANLGLQGMDGRGAVQFCSQAWGDYDNDGRPDIALSGWCETPGMATRVTRIMQNTSNFGPWIDITAGLGAMQYSSVAWADFDNDGDLDIASSGQVGGSDWERTGVHLNQVAGTANTPPSAPVGLSASIAGSDITFSWNAASDSQTPAGGLTYNLRIGTSPGSDNLMPAMANPTSGYRRIPTYGNAQKRLSWTLHNLPRPLYWSVQAVDSAHAGGAWAPEVLVP